MAVFKSSIESGSKVSSSEINSNFKKLVSKDSLPSSAVKIASWDEKHPAVLGKKSYLFLSKLNILTSDFKSILLIETVTKLVSEISKAFDQIFSDRELVDSLSHSTRLNFNANFQWDMILKQYEDLLLRYLK